MNPSASPSSNYQSPWLSSAVIGLVTALLFAPLCWRLTHEELASDHWPHLRFAIELAETGKPLPHPLLHYALLLLSPSDDFDTLAHTAAILYAICLGVSALFTARIFIHAAPQTGPVFLGWLALAMTLAMALPNWWNPPPAPHADEWWRFYRIYLLQVTPNCWHNPTAIFCMPFVLALNWLFVREMERMTRTSTLWIGVLIALTTFAKPNYILAFAPIYALHLAWYAYRLPESWPRRLGTFLLLELKAFGLLLPALYVQYLLLREISPDQQDVILLRPLVVWENYVPINYIPFAVLLGVFFPLVVFGCYPRATLKFIPLQRSWLVLYVALAQFVLLTQKDKDLHANFFWGLIFADRILFVQSTAFLLQQPPSNKRMFCFFCLSLHFISGMIYTAKCLFLTGNMILF